jgi:N-acetyl-gamma-glutamyl-phosphate reductase
MHKIFIDGHAGTTGLQIQDRLATRDDLEVLRIDDDLRKNTSAKLDLINTADIVVLCLPDDAAKQTVALAHNTKARILDASTAYRIDPYWTYGLPELKPVQRSAIAAAKYVSNPGCYPTGFLLAVAPLRSNNILKSDSQLSISAVSGYSGGGHAMMERYEERASEAPSALWHSRPYALKFGHKHLPEMQHYAELKAPPLFMPSVGHFAQGMLVGTPLAKSFFERPTSLDEIYALLSEYYIDEPCIKVHTPNSEGALDQGFLDPQDNNDTNRLDIHLFGNEQQMILVSQLDNLGKGAAGAAVQNLNLMLGIEELTGLKL